MQISSVVLVCDVKISQLGRKNLAVGLIKSIGGGSKPSSPSRGDGEILRGVDRYQAFSPLSFEHAFKID